VSEAAGKGRWAGAAAGRTAAGQGRPGPAAASPHPARVRCAPAPALPCRSSTRATPTGAWGQRPRGGRGAGGSLWGGRARQQPPVVRLVPACGLTDSQPLPTTRQPPQPAGGAGARAAAGRGRGRAHLDRAAMVRCSWGMPRVPGVQGGCGADACGCDCVPRAGLRPPPGCRALPRWTRLCWSRRRRRSEQPWWQEQPDL
jgi:hypothetical protein